MAECSALNGTFISTLLPQPHTPKVCGTLKKETERLQSQRMGRSAMKYGLQDMT